MTESEQEQDQGSDVPLGLATTEQLVCELQRRHVALLVVADGEIGATTGVDVTQVWVGGSRVHALGLAEWARQFLVTDAMDVAFDAMDVEGEDG